MSDDKDPNRGRDRIRCTVTILLALAGVGTMIAYITCDTACTYLQGEVVGVDLKYVGIAFMAAVGILAWLKSSVLLRTLLAAGLGAEIFLLWFQFRENIYCPYCLVFMTCLVAAFAVNHEKPQTTGWKGLFYLPGEVRLSETMGPYPLILFMLAGFGLIWLAFSGSTLPASPEAPVPTLTPAPAPPPPALAPEPPPAPVPSLGVRIYGRGATEIRVYTDYFCEPCRKAEQPMEPLTKHIVGKKKGRVLFIDTPMHRETILYARYYLYALGSAPHDFNAALRIRRALFDAAEKGITTVSGLEDFLRDRKIPFHSDDPKPAAFKQYNDYIKADSITSTPTIVVVTPEGKNTYTGADDIVAALENIKKGAHRAKAPQTPAR